MDGEDNERYCTKYAAIRRRRSSEHERSLRIPCVPAKLVRCALCKNEEDGQRSHTCERVVHRDSRIIHRDVEEVCVSCNIFLP